MRDSLLLLLLLTMLGCRQRSNSSILELIVADISANPELQIYMEKEGVSENEIGINAMPLNPYYSDYINLLNSCTDCISVINSNSGEKLGSKSLGKLLDIMQEEYISSRYHYYFTTPIDLIDESKRYQIRFTKPLHGLVLVSVRNWSSATKITNTLEFIYVLNAKNEITFKNSRIITEEELVVPPKE